MAFKEMNTDQLANSLGVNASEVREKQKLIELIVKTRKESKISQATLAKKAGVTQSRIAQIESGVGTSKVTFDVLFNILRLLGYDFKIMAKKAA
jgi:transcriptional regulator with XRE-family HTH domain